MADKEFSLWRRPKRSLAEVLASSRPPTEEVVTYKAERVFWPVYRFGRYTAVRAVVLFVTVAVGLYVTLIAANLGGKLDKVAEDNVRWVIGGNVAANPEYRHLTPLERRFLTEEMVQAALVAQGLDVPIYIRSLEWLPEAMALEFGRSRSVRVRDPLVPNRDLNNIRLIILERLPNTLLLMGLTNLVFFMASVSVGRFLSRRYGSRLDKLSVLLAPLSVAPAWFYGIFLVAIFAGRLRLLPFSGMVSMPPPETQLDYALDVLRHLVLPFTAVFFSVFFYTTYLWRTFFLIYSSEDYVEMARAKGLPARLLERRYILRPTLPTILTNLAVMLIGVWSGSIILERLFNWPGLGDLYYTAITRQDTALIVALTVVYAYFLVFTIFLLDIAYAFLDPRMRVGASGEKAKMVQVAGGSRWRRFRFWDRAPAPALPVPPGSGRLEAWGPRRPARSLSATLRGLAPNAAHYLKGVPAGLWRTGQFLRRLSRYPSAALGMLIILLLVGASVYTVRAIPLDEAVRLWRTSEAEWQESPRNARPVWFNYFSLTKLPESVVLDSRQSQAEKTVSTQPGMTDVTLTFTFDFPYGAFPQELNIYFYPHYRQRAPHVTLTWLMPDGREWPVAQLSPRPGQIHRFSEDSRLMRRLGGLPPEKGLFAVADSDPPVPLKGTYQLRVEALMFEDDADFDAKFIMRGQVYGWAGTDHQRRDLSIALLWGTPIALGFGLLAAVSTTFLTMMIAAVGAWRGGMVDELVQRITDVNMVLPLFPILAMFTALFTLRIWEVLGLAILLSIFGSAIKTYRALFLQVKESPYVEAALAYGAGNLRIIRVYLLPRVLPVIIPQIMTLVPTYVFLEAALAFFGVSDVHLPTWGKVINEAHVNAALVAGHDYWILQPTFLLMLTAFAFAMLGFTLDRIFNPRLREV
jgi:peptide/nickel transport system permease protein